MVPNLSAVGEQFRAIFEQSAAGIALVDLHGNFLMVNPAYTEILGYSLEEFTAVGFMQLTHPDDVERSRRVMQDVVSARGDRVRFAKRYLHKDGHTVWAEVCSTLMYGPSGEPSHFITHLIDVTERERAQLALRQEKERLAVTLRSIADGVITTNLVGEVLVLNAAAERLLAVDAKRVEGQAIASVLVLLDVQTRQRQTDPVTALVENLARAAELEHQVLVSADGTERFVTCQTAPTTDPEGNVTGVVLVIRDVTERQKLLETVQRAQRLESLGVLAGGIAHDFNNLLAGFFGYVDLAVDSAEDPTEVREYLANALMVLERARALTTQLLTFAKGGSPIRKVIDLGKLLRETVEFALAGGEITCKFAIAPDLENVLADPSQLAQVIDNLVINARQAMPRGGQIELTANNVTPLTPLPANLRTGRTVLIEVRDQGIGIPSENLPRIFDPFFTTKTQGHGLGLASAHSIITKHGGLIEATSEVGKGTSFRIWLPSSNNGHDLPMPGAARPNFAGRRILVLDDEDYLRNMASEMLDRFGCCATVARRGEEAVAWQQRAIGEGWHFDAFLLDLTVVGGMGGQQTLEQLRALDPRVVAIAVSGYTEDPIMDDPVRYGFATSVRKPYIMDDLAAALMVALRGAS